MQTNANPCEQVQEEDKNEELAIRPRAGSPVVNISRNMLLQSFSITAILHPYSTQFTLPYWNERALATIAWFARSIITH